jgi:hypothetical protein
VDTVLADGVRPRPTPDELIDLIERTNPTGRDLPRAKEQYLYKMKSRLQSVLLREHFDSVRVTVDEHDVAALSLAVSGRGAAHVPLDELDVDVRARVRRALDESDGGFGTVEKVERLKAVDADADPDIVDRVREELMQGVPAVARELMTDALSAAPQSSRGALLSSFVAMLAENYADELAIEIVGTVGHVDDSQLSAHARGALGLACARMGDGDRARNLLEGLRGSHASDAWAQLGLLALADGLDEAVEEARDAISAMDPTHPTLEHLERHLKQMSDDAAERAESVFAAAVASATTDDEREAIASKHLERWAGSRRARRIVDEIAHRRNDAERADLLRRADGEHDAHRRLALLRAARNRGASGIDDQITAAESAVADADEARAVHELTRRVAGGGVAGLKAWLDAPQRIREHVALTRELAEAGALGIGAGRGATARGCLAITKATAALDAGDLHACETALAAGGDDAVALAAKLGLKQRLDDVHREVSVAEDLEALDGAERAIALGDIRRAQEFLVGRYGERADGLRGQLFAMEEAARPVLTTPASADDHDLGSLQIKASDHRRSLTVRRHEILERTRETVAEVRGTIGTSEDRLIVIIEQGDIIGRRYWRNAKPIIGEKSLRYIVLDRKEFVAHAGSALEFNADYAIRTAPPGGTVVVLGAQGATVEAFSQLRAALT